MLLASNELFNLTAITEPSAIISDHLEDSVAITQYIDFNALHCIADIGTGAGFPGIPLKILFPTLKLILLEVNLKKVAFLQEVIKQLELSDCEVVPVDWRTFFKKN